MEMGSDAEKEGGKWNGGNETPASVGSIASGQQVRETSAAAFGGRWGSKVTTGNCRHGTIQPDFDRYCRLEPEYLGLVHWFSFSDCYHARSCGGHQQRASEREHQSKDKS
jgi:hypothetical protein